MELALPLHIIDALDAAILHLDLAGHEVFAFADRLDARGVPVIFHTGRRDVAPLRARYPGAPILSKPSCAEDVVRTLARAIAPPAQSGVAAS